MENVRKARWFTSFQQNFVLIILRANLNIFQAVFFLFGFSIHRLGITEFKNQVKK